MSELRGVEVPLAVDDSVGNTRLVERPFERAKVGSFADDDRHVVVARQSIVRWIYSILRIRIVHLRLTFHEVCDPRGNRPCLVPPSLVSTILSEWVFLR